MGGGEKKGGKKTHTHHQCYKLYCRVIKMSNICAAHVTRKGKTKIYNRNQRNTPRGFHFPQNQAMMLTEYEPSRDEEREKRNYHNRKLKMGPSVDNAHSTRMVFLSEKYVCSQDFCFCGKNVTTSLNIKCVRAHAVFVY
jgi:hypothetical protein